MPHSIYLVPDRQAVGRTTYQLRKFNKDLAKMDIPEPFKSVLRQRVTDFEALLKNGVIDLDDDGSVLEDSPDNNYCLGK